MLSEETIKKATKLAALVPFIFCSNTNLPAQLGSQIGKSTSMDRKQEKNLWNSNEFYGQPRQRIPL